MEGRGGYPQIRGGGNPPTYLCFLPKKFSFGEAPKEFFFVCSKKVAFFLKWAEKILSRALKWRKKFCYKISDRIFPKAIIPRQFFSPIVILPPPPGLYGNEGGGGGWSGVPPQKGGGGGSGYPLPPPMQCDSAPGKFFFLIPKLKTKAENKAKPTPNESAISCSS